MYRGKAVANLSAHNILLIDQLHCHVSPSRCKPLGNAQHECAVACTEVDYFARSHASPMLPQRARHDTVGHRNGVQSAEISPKAERARIIARNVVRQFGFNVTEQDFLYSKGRASDAARINIFRLPDILPQAKIRRRRLSVAWPIPLLGPGYQSA